MKILVTGAKGFVGRNLCSQLNNIKTGKAKCYGDLQIDEVFEYDLDSTMEQLEAWCSECDFVFNLAGVNRPQNPEEFMTGNFGFASTLLDTLKKHGNKAPVMLSSSAQASLTGRFGNSKYGRSKKAGEDLFLRYGAENGIKVLVYRFPNLYGKWCRPNYNSAIATFCNNIAELYSQFELLYNNSINMVCWSSRVYHENRDKEIEEDNNPHYGEPFPAFRGHVLFRACHCPGKSTVFGIEKQNQDVYNKEELACLIGKTVITRKFRDFAGEKYRIRTHTVSPSDGEREVYRVIIEEFCRICELYYNSTGDAKKDAGLRLMRQIKLLIKACSVPHLIEGYSGDGIPSKTRYIERLVRKIPGKVAVGCTSIAAFDLYEKRLRECFPDRPVFVVKGDVAFKKRQSIVTEFDSTVNGILVCTQQSLSSSVNIPTCNDVILESLQWNIPKMEQFYFRFIRLDSKELKGVHYVTYKDSVEQNLMALVLTKERLNEFIKTGEVKEQSEIFEEFDVTMSVIESLLVRERDSEGKIHISWGSQRIMN